MMSVRYTGVLKVCRKVKMQCMAITYIFSLILLGGRLHQTGIHTAHTQYSHPLKAHITHPLTAYTTHTHPLLTPLTPTEVVV